MATSASAFRPDFASSMAAERSEGAAAFGAGATSCASRSKKRDSSQTVGSAAQTPANSRKSAAWCCYRLGCARRGPGGNDGNELGGDDGGDSLRFGILFTSIAQFGGKHADAPVDACQRYSNRAMRRLVGGNRAHLCTPPRCGGRVRCVARNRAQPRDDALVVTMGERGDQLSSGANPHNEAVRVEGSGSPSQRVAQRTSIGRTREG